MRWDTQCINMFSLWISLKIILIFHPPQNSPQRRRKRSLFQAGKWGSHQGVAGTLSLSALKAWEDVSECLRSKLIKDQFLIFVSPKDSKVNIFPLGAKEVSYVRFLVLQAEQGNSDSTRKIHPKRTNQYSWWNS